jgi:hypothetical protein
MSLTRLPYQPGYSRKAFRAPSRPAASGNNRRNWFRSVFGAVGAYHEDIEWLAQWAAYIHSGYAGYQLGPLFAAVIDAGGETGDRVFNILLASGRGDHEIAAMGRHVVRGLLSASRPDGWTFIERMLLAAQREEGLRQTILEAVDEAHPQAFRRILRVVVENNLARFSATVRALNVWLAYNGTQDSACRQSDAGAS